jgi:hypothetical protein
MSVQSWICDPSSFQLTTAEILYRIPDYPKILQSFIWEKLGRIDPFRARRGPQHRRAGIVAMFR